MSVKYIQNGKEKGYIRNSGFNSYNVIPKGYISTLSNMVDTKVAEAVKDSRQELINTINTTRQSAENAIEVSNTLSSKVDKQGNKVVSIEENYGTRLDGVETSAYYGILLDNGGHATGFETGSILNRTTGEFNDFFGIRADKFYVTKSSVTVTNEMSNDQIVATLEANDIAVTDDSIAEAVGQTYNTFSSLEDPALAINWDGSQYNTYFNGKVHFQNLANSNGETIIDGGLIDTDTVVANRIAIGMSNMSKYLGEFSKAPGDNGIYTDNIDPHVFDHYEIKSGDSYFDIPTGMLMVYDGNKWYGNKGEDGQSSSGYDMLLSDANVVISRSASGEWVTDKAQTGVKIMFGLLDVTNKFELSLEDTTNFSFASNDDVKFTTEVSNDIVKPQYSTNVIAKPLSGGVKLYFLSYTINNSNDLAIVRGYTSYNSKVTIFDTDKVKIIGSCSTTDKIESFEINVPISHKGTKEYLIEATDFLNNKIYSKISIYRDTIVCGGSILNSDKTLFTYVKEPNSKIKVKISDGADNSVTKTFYPNDEDTNTVDISSYNFSSDATAHSTLTDSRGLVSEYDDTIVDKLTDLDSISNMPENSISALEIKQKFSVYGLEDGTGYSLQLDKLQLKLLGNGEFNHADGAYVVKYKVLKTTGASAVEMKSGFKVTAIPYKENGDILGGDSNTVVGDNKEGSFTLSEDQLKKETDTVMVKLEVLIDNTYVLVDKQPMTVLFNPGSPYVVDLDNDTHICPSNPEGGEVLVTECNTTVSVWLGVNKYSIDGVDITMTGNGKKVDRGNGVDQVDYDEPSKNNGMVYISVSHYGADAPDSVALKIQPYKKDSGNNNVNVGNPIVFSISKGKQGFTGGSGDVYKLIVSPRVVKVIGSADGKFTITVVKYPYKGSPITLTSTSELEGIGLSVNGNMYNDGKDGAVAYNTVTNNSEYTVLLKRGDEVLDREIVSTVKDGKNGDDSTVAGPRGSVTTYTKIHGELFTTSNYTLTGDEDFGANNDYNNGFDIPGDHDKNGNDIGFLWEDDNSLSHKAWSVLGYRTMFEVNGNTIAKGDTNIVTVYNYDTGKVVGQIEIVYIGTYTTNFNNVKKDDFLFDVKLHVHGDAVIDKTLSVGALVNQSATDTNEVRIKDGRLYATKINADTVNFNHATISGTLDASNITVKNLTADSITSNSISKVSTIQFDCTGNGILTSSNDPERNSDKMDKGTNDSDQFKGVVISSKTFTVPSNHYNVAVLIRTRSYGRFTGDEKLVLDIYLADDTVGKLKSADSSTDGIYYVDGTIMYSTAISGDLVFIYNLNVTNISDTKHYHIRVNYNYDCGTDKIEDQWFEVSSIITSYR